MAASKRSPSKLVMNRLLQREAAAALAVLIHFATAALTACAAPLDSAVDLNRKWAEQLFPAASASRLVICHEDEPGDTKIGRCAAGGPLRLGS